MDVNQSPYLEGVLLYQMVKETLHEGKNPWYSPRDSLEKPYVRPYLTSYTKDNIFESRDWLIPFTDINQFIIDINNNQFAWSINDPKFIEIS